MRAYIEVLDEDGAVNQKAIAAKCGVSRQALWKMHLRHPWLAKWVSDQIERHTDGLVGPVIRKMGLIGLRGSKDHAELFLKSRGKLTLADDATMPPGGRGPTTINLLIPRPGEGPLALQAKVG